MNTSAVVLVIEPDAEQLDRLRERLEALDGFTVRGCVSPANAVPLFAELTPSLVLLGPSFPEADAATWLERLRARASVPILALAAPRGPLAESLLAAGVEDVIDPAALQTPALERRVAMMLELASLRNARSLLESELREAQRLASIGILAGGIAHDLNNVLTGMLGETQLALAQSAGREVEANLKRLDEACTGMSEMVRSLMTFGSRETRRRVPIDAGAVTQHTRQLLEHSVPKSIHFETDLAEDAIVLGSRSAIQQIVLNLAVNAVEAMPEGGHLGIAVRPVRPDGDLRLREPEMRDEEYVLLEVTDTGHGIAPELRDRIFEPYFSTKNRGAFNGSGLGLATVSQLVRELKGIIAVESTRSVGSAFRVYLPRHVDKAAQPEPPKPEGLPKGTESVLVVDDEPVVLHVTSRLLQHLGYKPFCAGSGQEALDLVESVASDIACAILDLSMPEMSGVECSRKLRAVAPDLPIIFASGLNLEAEEDELAREGAVACIQKPFQMRDLAVRLRAALDAQPANAR